jgi:hypothetical protein
MRDYASMLSRKSTPTMPRGKARTAWLMTEWETTKVATIDVDAVERFEQRLRAAGLSARTRRKYTVLLSMLLDYAVKKRVATINPLATRGRQRNGRKQTKDVAVYSLAVVEQIAAACDDEQLHRQHHPACRLDRLPSGRTAQPPLARRSLEAVEPPCPIHNRPEGCRHHCLWGQGGCQRGCHHCSERGPVAQKRQVKERATGRAGGGGPGGRAGSRQLD